METHSMLQNAIHFIESNMRADISLDDLARESFLSRFYFHRLFTRLFGITPMEYVKKRRLTAAARRIRENCSALSGIAEEVGYRNYEQFSRDFKREFSLSPSVYKKTGAAVLLTPELDSALLIRRIDEERVVAFDSMTLCVRIEELEEAHTVGISKLCGLTRGIDDPGELHGRFDESTVNSIPNQITPPVEYGIGISNYVDGNRPRGFTYIVSRQVSSYGGAPESLTRFTIPPGMYAVCRVEAESFDRLTNEAMYLAAGYMLKVWLSDGNERCGFAGNMTIEKYYSDSAGAVPYFDYCFPVVMK